MKRREFLKSTSVIGAAVVSSGMMASNAASPAQGATKGRKLTPPAAGKISVGFVLEAGATMIDFAGPWEVFQDVTLLGGTVQAFKLFIVSETLEPVTATGGMRIIPDYTYAKAPTPNVIVVPAVRGMGSAASHEWLRKVHMKTDVTMSVCTGAFTLAAAGLLAGKEATTHHDYFDMLEKQFPDIKVKRGLRFIEGDKISTAGGLTSGIDLSLRVVERYFGREVAQQTATYMEYESKGWIVGA